MKIGHNKRGYAETRNFLDMLPEVEYQLVPNSYKVKDFANRVASKLLRFRPFEQVNLNNSFKEASGHKIDLIHLFNAVSFGSIPWVTTFETVVPRYRSTLNIHHGKTCDYSSLKKDSEILKALKVMAGDPCKRLIALSRCNYDMQKELLKQFPEYRHAIEAKLVCLHPPQELLVRSWEEKSISLDGQVRLMFVGKSFFQKGGMEILTIFLEMKKKFQDLHLTIVSGMDTDSYATMTGPGDVGRAMKMIEENSDCIDYHKQLPNSEVLALMKSAHVGLLPSYAETYGYSLLEFQAAGCPVITTDIRAFPEINGGGWVIPVPRNRLGEAIYTTPEDRAAISEAIKDGLRKALEEIRVNREILRNKSEAAIQHIQESHSIDAFREKLRTVYKEALA